MEVKTEQIVDDLDSVYNVTEFETGSFVLDSTAE